MKKFKTVVTAFIDKKHLKRLEAFCEINVMGWAKTGNFMQEDELIEALKDTGILIVGYERVSATVMEKCPNLRVIACCRSNPVNVDVDMATEKNIPVIYTPGRNANAVAEFTMGLIISAARNIPQSYCKIKQGNFLGNPASKAKAGVGKDVIWNAAKDDPTQIFKGYELKDRILGIVGLGRIGVKVAKLAQAFGMQTVGYDPYCSKEKAESDHIRLLQLEELFAESDYVSIHCSLCEETIGLIGAKEISLMRPSAVIINTARAAIINEEALIRALKQKSIRGAALDVFWEEPLPSNSPLLELDNVILTPHLGGASYDVNSNQSEMITQALLSLLENKSPCNIINPQVLQYYRIRR